MTSWDTIHSDLLGRYPKPIAHLWRQIREDRFGLVLGAGVCDELDLPDWRTLLQRISDDRNVRGKELIASQGTEPAASLAQMLFQRFADRFVRNASDDLSQEQIRRSWRDVVRRQLYKKARKKDSTYLQRHYLKEYLPLIRRIPMTVNYNFDDVVERLLDCERKASDGGGDRSKPYETVWSPDIQPRRSRGVIYHPNGLLPKNEAERGSEGLVLCEGEFADQLMESIAGRYASLLHFFSRHTCLLIGLSLNDATLKYLLRQNAQLNPGHFHYYVAHEKGTGPTLNSVKSAIFDANFEVHNLITLFLTSEQIAALGHILNYDDAHGLLCHAKDAGQPLRYYYYVTGVPGAGKSSAIAHLRSFVTYDEWLDARLPDMSRRTDTVRGRRTAVIDAWVARQFDQKNRLLMESPEKRIGIHVLDRCILDPMSFKRLRERPKRARTMLDKVCGASRKEEIQSGMVFLIDNDAVVIERRCMAGGKSFTHDDLEKMQAVLSRAYGGRHLRTVNARDRCLPEVARELIRLILTEEYEPLDLKQRLAEIESGRFKW